MQKKHALQCHTQQVSVYSPQLLMVLSLNKLLACLNLNLLTYKMGLRIHIA